MDATHILTFDTTVDEGRVEHVREQVPPAEGAARSFETVRTNGPLLDLMPDGTLRLGSPKRESKTERFGLNVSVESVGSE